LEKNVPAGQAVDGRVVRCSGVENHTGVFETRKVAQNLGQLGLADFASSPGAMTEGRKPYLLDSHLPTPPGAETMSNSRRKLHGHRAALTNYRIIGYSRQPTSRGRLLSDMFTVPRQPYKGIQQYWLRK
jgi:hypothetical protein